MATKKPLVPVPDIFEGFVGQESLVSTLRLYMNHLPIFPNTFFTAMKGSGKTDLARRIAAGIQHSFYEIGCRQGMKLDNILYRIALGWSVKDGGVVFFDELPLMQRSAQGSLRILTEEGHYSDADGFVLEFPSLTVLAAGSDPTKVDDDLMDRFEVMEFEQYTIDQLTMIGSGLCERLEFQMEYSTIEKLAIACNGSPRTLRKLFEHSVNVAIKSDDKPTAESILTIARMDNDGLTPLERTILISVGDLIKSGSGATVSRIATALRMRERAIYPAMENLEAYGFVRTAMGPGGRKLTPDGILKYRALTN